MKGGGGARRRRSRSAGLVFLLGAGVLLAAALAGGQVWAMSGSVTGGVAAAAVIATLLSMACRPLLRTLSRAGRQVMGEQRGDIDEDEFTDVVDVVVDATPRGRIARGVETRPERVADSVRSLLGDPAGRRQRRR